MGKHLDRCFRRDLSRRRGCCTVDGASSLRQGLVLFGSFLGLLGVMVAMGLPSAEGQPQPAPPAVKAPIEKYPRVNLSIWYEVDTSWPRRPEGMPWGDCPAVDVDRMDRVWIYTRAKPPVQVFSAEGEFLFAWGADVFGELLDKMTAHGLRIDHEGNVWLVDLGNHIVLKMSMEGKILQMLGTPGEAGCDERHFCLPTDVAISPAGDIFVADGYGNARVAHFDRLGRLVNQWGELGVKPGQFSLVHAIALDSKGRVYVADRNNARIQVFDQKGRFLAEWRNLIVPWGLWMTKDDELWVCGCSPMVWRETDEVLSCPPKDQLVARFDTSGRMLQLWTIPKGEDGKEKPGEVNWLHTIALDSKGNLYLGDIVGKRVQKFIRHQEVP
ncbi:MAG: peptidyl-alpha-hydroxyglycine alpha-amidating lyase family protein [Thermoguttaceae bacterium]|nr:peptidyl-alpha-hydroxyglycine alpha-amidating lyase family protein [Thermoguttaceae bacterium]MDW8080127.1 peptidyl-alpha-hydroxyglycine alpha-amidating lyase family protein [Thermoguttaceae bacterium]